MQNQSGYNTWVLLSQKYYLFFFFFFCLFFFLSSSFCFAFFSFIYRNFRYVAVFRTVDIVKERSCAMPLLNILIANGKNRPECIVFFIERFLM